MLKDSDIVAAMSASYRLSTDELTWFDSLYVHEVAARFEADGRFYKLKRFRGKLHDLERLAHRHILLQEKMRGVLPTWQVTTCAKPYIELGDNLYYVTDWVSGRTFGHTQSDAHALGRLLSYVHAFDPPDSGFQVPRMQQRLRTTVQAKRILGNGIAQRMPDPIRTFLRREAQSLREQMSIPLRQLRLSAGYLSPAVVHGDVTIPNLLYDEHRARLIDWETANGGFAVEELAKTAMNTCNLSIPLVDSLLDGYHFDALSPEQRAAFLCFLHIPREIVYLLHKAVRRVPNEQDRAQWQLVMQTWRDRETLLNRYPL